MRIALVAALAAASLARGQEPGSASRGVPVWLEDDGQTCTLGTLPDLVDRESRAALERWLGFLAESEVAYTAEVLTGGRGVHIFAPEIVVEVEERAGPGSTRADRRRKLERERKQREKEEAERLAREGPPKPPEELRREHLRDVRESFEAKLAAPGPRRLAASLWTRGTQRAQAELPVLILVRDRADFRRVLDGVLAANPFLADHVANLKASLVSGTVIESPLVGVVIQEPEESDEYLPHHELVKKEVELLLFKRFGPLPFFVEEGVAWCFEWGEFGELRTFTGRTEFIGKDDPAYGGWSHARDVLFQAGRGFRFESDVDVMKRLRKWRSDEYRDDLAAASFALTRCLLEHHGDQSSEILARWGAATCEQRGRLAADGGWRLDPEFVLGPDDLVAGLDGVDLLASIRAHAE